MLKKNKNKSKTQKDKTSIKNKTQADMIDHSVFFSAVTFLCFFFK